MHGPWPTLLPLLLTPALLGETAGGDQARLAESYGQLPLSFEANVGQAPPEVSFLSRGPGYTLFLTPQEAVLSLQAGHPGEDARSSASTKPAVLRLQLRGANPSPHMIGLEPQSTRSNYFLGSGPDRWHTDVPHFGKVRYGEVYPGIDLVYYGQQRQLEYDFVVQPGADPGRIRLHFEGAQRLETDAQGDLLVHVGAGTLRQHKPLVYQEREGIRQLVAGAYVVEGRRHAAFRLGRYDRSRPLVIDPVLVYSTYLGGTAVESGWGIAEDGAGSVYVTGYTTSANFPLANALQSGHAGGVFDVFVTKLNAAGSALVYSTYLGGNGGAGNDYATGVAVDGAGNAYVTGYTESTNFPTLNPVQGSWAGGGYDAFVAKLNAAGSALVYSTYLGGSAFDQGYGIAADASGNAYVTGYTESVAFPLASPYQGALLGTRDAFVTKLNVDGAFVYSTYLGGSAFDDGFAVAADGGGSAYVTGRTSSMNYPTVNPLQGTLAGGGDVFVTKLNAAGSALVYSTYLGGTSSDDGAAIAVDAGGNAHVTGVTSSTDFPTVNPVQSSYSDRDDAFVAKLNAVGSALVYSTYLGGSAQEMTPRIATDGRGCAHVAGRTLSTDFPTANPIQGSYAGGSTYGGDAFVARLASDGSTLLYSTYVGGSADDAAWGVAADVFGNTYVTGFTSSTNFPTAHPLQATNAGGTRDVIVLKLAVMPKGDIDRDGAPDLYFRSTVNGAQNKAWLMNGVARISEVPITPNAGPNWRIRGVDDFNADEKTDLVFWNQVSGGVEFWLMNGISRPSDPVPLTGGATLPTNWDLAATADLNHDGRPDLVWRNYTSQKLVIWTMNGTTKAGNIIPTPDLAVDANWAVVAALDYSGDGNTDFLWYNSTSGKIVTWYMDASVMRTSGQFTTPANAGNNNWKVVAGGDYSGRNGPGPLGGSPDVVWRNETSGNQVVWHMDFNSTRVHGEFTSPMANTPAVDWTIVGPR